MNQKLAESLAGAVAALSPEDYNTFQNAFALQAIQKTSGICGGHARIRNTRIPVWTIISLQKQGADTNELLTKFPSLTPFDLLITQSYYDQHQAEIDDLLRLHQDNVDVDKNEQDETAYLLQSDANRSRLLESIERSKNPENLIEVDLQRFDQ
jgi:uncharacterized protein (DUF433 family)